MSGSGTQAATTGRLADRLAQARRRRFVGRRDEIAVFQSALSAFDPPFSVIHVHGPGGVGKTTLLGEYTRLASEANRPSVWLDGRNIEASPPGLLISLSSAMGLSDGESPLQVLDQDWRGVIFIDTYELLSPIDNWLREVFLPQLPERSLVVIAGRNAPATAWRTDSGWSELVRELPLRNLTPDESRHYLEARGVAEKQHPAVLEFTYGHPLALSLVADVIAQGTNVSEIDPTEHPDVVGTLVDRFVQGAPTSSHRRAIEICAHARVTTEALLVNVFGEESGHELFTWLRGLSFIEQGAEGIFPHDLARDVLDADIQWRDPDTYRKIHRAVRTHIVDRLQRSQGINQQRAFFDLLFLHRNNPFMRQLFDWKELGKVYAEPAKLEDYPAILEIVRRHESEELARIAEYWLQRQPEAFHAYRSHGEDLLGFACILMLGERLTEDSAADPAVDAVWTYMDRYGPLRQGEVVMLARIAMSAEWGHDDGGQIANMVAMSFTTCVLTNPRLAWSFIVEPRPEVWHASHTYLNQFRSPEAEFDVGGTHFSMYSHDWRVESPLDWLETMSDREIAIDLNLEVLEAARPASVIVLSQPEFREAVRRALREYTRPDSLGKNPLVRSRLIAQNSDELTAPERLQSIIREAAEALRGNPKDERLYRAVRRTYLEPAETQELAAESLDLPFSTYRYHLTNGVDRITAWLWERELNPTES